LVGWKREGRVQLHAAKASSATMLCQGTGRRPSLPRTTMPIFLISCMEGTGSLLSDSLSPSLNDESRYAAYSPALFRVSDTTLSLTLNLFLLSSLMRGRI
jgi:hypothetical protein